MTCDGGVLMLLLVLSYHRRLRIISEALELYVEVGRVSHSWCICVVGHGYGGLGWDGDGSCGWYACEIEPVRLVTCREMPEHFPSTS